MNTFRSLDIRRNLTKRDFERCKFMPLVPPFYLSALAKAVLCSAISCRNSFAHALCLLSIMKRRFQIPIICSTCSASEEKTNISLVNQST